MSAQALAATEPATAAPDVSFAILSWNSAAYLERCLVTLKQAVNSAGLSYEVLFLDNGSRDASPSLLAQMAAADPTHVFVHYENSNLGTTRSRNILFARARGTYLCVMDSDVELANGVVEHLIGVLRADPRIGIAVPRILYPSGAWQKSFDRFPTVIDKVNRLMRLREIEKREADQLRNATGPREVDYAISAFWLMRRDLLRTVGNLDERIFYAPEDTDFCLRVWRSGYRIVYDPAVTIVHHTQEISRGFRINRAKLSHMKGLLYYFMKHRYFLRRPRASSGS